MGSLGSMLNVRMSPIIFFTMLLSFSFDVGQQQDGAFVFFPDVLVEFVALTLLTNITGDGCIPHLVEETVNVTFCLVDVLFLIWPCC